MILLEKKALLCELLLFDLHSFPTPFGSGKISGRTKSQIRSMNLNVNRSILHYMQYACLFSGVLQVCIDMAQPEYVHFYTKT